MVQDVPKMHQDGPKVCAIRAKVIPRRPKDTSRCSRVWAKDGQVDPRYSQSCSTLQARGEFPSVGPPLPLRGRLWPSQKALLEKIHPQKTNDSTAVWHFFDYFFVSFGVPCGSVSQRRPRGVPKASRRRPQGVPKASQGVPKASQRHPKASKGVLRRPQGVPKACQGVPKQPEGV